MDEELKKLYDNVMAKAEAVVENAFGANEFEFNNDEYIIGVTWLHALQEAMLAVDKHLEKIEEST